MASKAKVLATVLPLVVCGLGAVFLGKDTNWDLRNYHYYNAYAFLEGRLDVDIAPAQLQTFFNPLLDLPFYWMTLHFPSKAIGFVLGFVHGINLALLFFIFCRITAYTRDSFRIAIGIAVLLVAAAAPGFISELGTTMNDNVTSLFVLAPVFLILLAYDNFTRQKAASGPIIGMAGFLMGAGVGLKPTIAIYALGSAAALLALFATRQDRSRYFISYAVAAVAGGIASGGLWWWELWKRYANPLFPFFNNIFQSPYVSAGAFTDNRFLPQHAWEYFAWPLIFTWNSQRVAELRFADLRFAVIYLAFLAWGISSLWKFKTGKRYFHAAKTRFLIVFFILSFILWMAAFSIYRYLLVLELLAPLLFLALLERIVPSHRMRLAVVLAVTLAMAAVFRPPNWGRDPWSDPYVAIRSSEARELPDNAVIVMLGGAPMAYVIPQFPATARFIRPEGNLGLQESDQLFKNIKLILDEKKEAGKLFVLFSQEDRGVDLETSALRLGLDLRRLDCFFLDITRQDHLKLCQVTQKTSVVEPKLAT